MKKKHILIAAIIVFVIAVVLFFLIMAKKKEIKEFNEVVISDVDVSNIPDGSYEGEYEFKGLYVKVSTTVRDKRIEKVDILEHRVKYGDSGDSIVEDVISNQKLNIDLVSGATVSSKCILKAIEDSLNNSK